LTKAEQAVACFGEGHSCSQAVLSTYGPELGLERELALKAAQGLGGGMGHLGEVCGAVTGAFIVLGLRYGTSDAADRAARDRVYQRVRELAERFAVRRGSILCRELLGCDIGTPEGLSHAREQGLFSTLCPALVRDASELLEQLSAE